MENKFISVIIPAYNAEKTIGRTLASLISNKDYISEIIMVDDNSTDDTVKQALKFSEHFNNFHIIGSEGWHNPGLARKTGMIHAHGEWITFLDADDCFTPSSLRYVSKQIADSDAVILLCQSIYYESGSFAPETIGHTDISCGGNFYKKDYLINNNLYPHNKLLMAEDEYFNEIILKYIEYCDPRSYDELVKRYDYPVYEVHHDIEDGLSFALSNWVDYICKYHLLYKEYVMDFFKDNKELRRYFVEEYMDSFIFCYLMMQGLMLDDDVYFDYEYNKRYFIRAIKYFEDYFNLHRYCIVSYYNSSEGNVISLLKSAISTIGFEYNEFLSFSDFIDDLT